MCSARSTGLLAPAKLPTESARFHEVLLGVYICVDQAVPLKMRRIAYVGLPNERRLTEAAVFTFLLWIGSGRLFLSIPILC